MRPPAHAGFHGRHAGGAPRHGLGMTSITLEPRSAEPGPAATPPPRRRRLRERIARLERPLLFAGLALVTAHLLDLALSGPTPPCSACS